MKKKQAERSLTGLLAAWLLLMAVWLVPGSAWARIAPNGGEATPARGAYEVLAETSAEVRGVSTAAPNEGEESVAEGQRTGVPTEAGALRPVSAAERTSPAVSARVGRPRAGNGTLKFILDPATQAEPNMRAQSLFAKSVGGVLGVIGPKPPVKDGETFPAGVGHFTVGYFIGEPSNGVKAYFKLKSKDESVFALGTVEFEITVVAKDRLADIRDVPQPYTVWMRNHEEDVNVYIHKIESKIPFQIKHYVDGSEISAPSKGWKLLYDQVRKVGWRTDGERVPHGATLRYNWMRDSVKVDGVAMRPKRILINGEECPIPEASKDGEAPKVGEWNVPNAAGEVIIKVEWEKDVRKITWSVNDVNRQSETKLASNGQEIVSGSSIDGKITEVDLAGTANIGFTAFAVSVNGKMTRLPESVVSGSSFNKKVTLPADGEDANIVVYYVPFDERGNYYTVSVDPSITHGTVTVNLQIAKVGDTIKLTIKPDLGFACKTVAQVWHMPGGNFETSSPYLYPFFLMEANDVTVKVTFEEFPGVVFMVDGGAKVTLVDSVGKSYTVTDTDGDRSVLLPNVPLPTKGNVTVEATVDGATRRLEVPVTVDVDGTASPSNLTLHAVTVKVVEQGTTTGIENATVTIGGQKATADGDGVAKLYLVKGVDYEKTKAAATGYTDSTVTLKVDAAGNPAPAVIELVKKPVVTARVNRGATVTLVDSVGNSYKDIDTDKDGRVTLPSVPMPTKGKVTVEANGHKVEVSVEVGANGKMSPSDLTLYPIGIKVVEKDATSEEPIDGATVTVGEQKGTANGSGVATLYLVKGVTYKGVKASATGYADSTVKLTVDSTGRTNPRVIELAKKALVNVTVTKDGNSVTGAAVTIVGKDGIKHEATTGANGKAEVPDVPQPTEGTVTVEKDGKVVTVPVKVDEHGGMTPSTVDLSDANIAPVTVTVVEKGATPEKPIIGATVTVGAQKVQAGANGEVTLRLVKNATYAGVKAVATGYLNDTVTLKVNDDGSVTPNKIELRKTAPVAVTVTDGGTGVDGARVTIVDNDGKKHEATTGADGRTTVQGVPVPTAGTVTVAKDGKVVTVPVTVDEHGVMDPSTVDISSTDIVEVTVTVVEKGTTTGIANATVTVGAQAVQTGANGEVTLRLVKNGTYNGVTASATGYTAISGQTLTVDGSGNATPAQIELAKAGTPGVTFTVDNGATVTINGNGGIYTATAEAGKTEVKVPSVPDITTGGTVTVKATVDGQERVVTVPVTVANGVATPSDLKLHEVRVTVVEQGTATGIASATVTVGGQEATTDGSGVATLHLVKDVTYRDLGAAATGYTAIGGQTLTVDAAGVASPAQIALAKAVPPVTVTVDGGATVTLVDADGKSYTETDTDGNGEVTLPNVPVPTAGTVTVEANGHTVKVPVTVGADGTMSPRDLKLYPVTVTVVERGTATGIANATVTVGGQEATADGSGEATLHLVKDATYRDLGAAAAGYTAIGNQTLTVDANGDATPVQIELAKAGQSNPYLHVFVVDENLQAIDKVSVSVKDEGSQDTDPAGHAAWQLAANRPYDLTLKKEGYVTVTTSVRLEALGHDLTVVMQREAKADPKKEDPKGQVTAVESELLAGASLYPNPAREYTTLQGLEYADAVSILTLSGVEVQRLAVPGEREHQLDVSSLAEGIYLVVLETRGSERRTLKLVVRR